MSSNLRIDAGLTIQLAARYRAYDGARMIVSRYCKGWAGFQSLQSDIFRLFQLNFRDEGLRPLGAAKVPHSVHRFLPMA